MKSVRKVEKVADAVARYVRPRVTRVEDNVEVHLEFNAHELLQSEAATGVTRFFADGAELHDYLLAYAGLVWSKLPLGWRLARTGDETWRVVVPYAVLRGSVQ